MPLGTAIEIWQFEYLGEFGSIIFGEDTAIDVVEIEGLDLPGMRTADAVLAGAHGSLAGQDRLESRDVTIKLQVFETDEATMWEDVHAVALATQPTDVEMPLTFKIGDQPAMRIYCRARRRNIPIKQAHLYNFVDIDIQFNASDPFIYSEAEYISSTNAPTNPQGRAFSATYPWNFGVPGEGGVINVNNDGTAPTPWVARIFGPCVNPSIIGPGGQITWESSLQAGEFVEFDAHPARQTVLVGGSSSQFGQLTDDSVWFLLPAGSSNVVINTGDGNGSLELRWRDAWWSAT